MAESRVGESSPTTRKRSRVRSGRRFQARHNLVGFHGHGLLALIFFAIVALSVLGVGLGIASLTIFAVGRGGPSHHAAVANTSASPSASATQGLVGHPVDGAIVGVLAGQDLVAIQPTEGLPVEATVTAKSKLTRLGMGCTIDQLIPGDLVVVTFAKGPHGTLRVLTLDDFVTMATSQPSTSLTPLPNVTATPTPTPVPTAPPNPTPNPSPQPSPSKPGGPPVP